MKKIILISAGIVLVVILGRFGWAYYQIKTAATKTISIHPSALETTPATITPTTGLSNLPTGFPVADPASAPSATIDKSSLISATIFPTITGTAKNTSYIKLSIRTLDGQAWGGTGDIPVVNGRWSATDNPTTGWNPRWGIVYDLTRGSYIVNVYPEAKSESEANMPLANRAAIATGTLVIDAVAPPTISSFTVNGASNTTITKGSSITLSWHTAGATSCELWSRNVSSSNNLIGGVGALPPQKMGDIKTNGSMAVSPAGNTEYTISCSNSGGSNNSRTTVIVGL